MLAAKTPLSDAPELCRLGAAELASGYASGKFSPVDVAKATIARAEAINPELNAFTIIDGDRAIQAARESEKRWQNGVSLSGIDGVPTTLKDIVWVDGWSVRYGSCTTDPKPCVADAPSVERLRRAGAVFIGQTATPEFGWKAVTDSPLGGVTRNPWNSERTPGGSSGGAAVAAATGAGVLHLGTDGGGSIRIPASFTGIVGHKPTFGRVPAYPASSFGTVAHIGPMTRTVSDAAAMLQAMSGRDVRDWMQGAGLLPSLGAVKVDFSGMKIGYWSRPPVGKVDPEVQAIVDATVKRLEEAGAVVEPVELPDMDLLSLFHIHWLSGAANRLGSISASQRKDMDPGLLDAAATGAGYDAAAFMAAQGSRAEFGIFMDRLLDRYDLVVSPATALPAFEAGKEVPEGSGLGRWTEWASFSFPINLSQQPACIVPCGLTEAKLPVGFQIIGARGNDAGVLAAAQKYQDMFPGYFIGNGK